MEINELEKLLSCNQLLQKHIEDFIEIFVEYYGEEQRENIEKRLDSSLIVGYQSDFGSSILRELEKNKSNELYDKLIESSNLEVNKELLFDGHSFEYKNLHPIKKYQKFYNEILKGPEKRLAEAYESLYKTLKNFGAKDLTFDEYMEMVKAREIPDRYKSSSDKAKKLLLEYSDINNFSYKENYEREKREAVKFLLGLNQNVTMENIEEKAPLLDEVNDLLKEYNYLEIEYEKFKEEYKKYFDIIEYNNKLKEELEKKYYINYLKDILPYVSDDFKDKISSFINENKTYDSYISNIFGMSNFYISSIEYFSKDQELKLNDEETSDWEKEQIKKNRIKYFKNIGIDLGNNYEEYEKIKDKWPDESLIDKIIELKEKNKNNFNVEYYNSIIPNKYVVEEQQRRRVLNFTLTDSAEIYINKQTCVLSHIVENNGIFECAPTVMINFDRVEAVRDHFIIHELNHVYELSLKEVAEDYYTLTCGWETYKGNFNDNEEKELELDRPKRQYELFNEIINEKIAKDISEIMVSKGIAFFGEPTEKSYRNVTGYDSTNYLVSEFFEKYKKEILASRSNGNIEIIYNAVGKENFDELNSLFVIHNEYFSGLKYYSLLKDLKEKKDNENTRIYFDLLERKNKILSKMEKNYQLYIQSQSIETKKGR